MTREDAIVQANTQAANQLKAYFDPLFEELQAKGRDIFANGQGLAKNNFESYLRDDKRWVGLSSYNLDQILQLAGYVEIRATTKKPTNNWRRVIVPLNLVKRVPGGHERSEQ